MKSSSPMPVRIVTNIRFPINLDGVVVDDLASRADFRFGSFIRRCGGAAALVMKLPGKRIALMCLLAKLRYQDILVVYYDVLIPTADTWWERFKRRIYLGLVRRADLILTVHRDTSEYSRLLRLPPDRFHYIGFKSNVWEDEAAVLRGAQTEDQGKYVLACGRSYRDFKTFVEAMAVAGIPARILVTQGRLEPHGSIPPPVRLPENVELMQHNGTRAGWIEALLGARIVVIPMRGDVVNASVSVPLEAMNLSRAVIITEGPATRGMLDNSIVGIVPPEDSATLASEAVRVWNDHELRRKRIANGLNYVKLLGGVERMSEDILRATLAELIRGRSPT
jgi:glycosyltransferase involved in cell wall biosynthesis